MIRTGDTIHNPVTGERITFHATSADTNGESVVIDMPAEIAVIPAIDEVRGRDRLGLGRINR